MLALHTDYRRGHVAARLALLAVFVPLVACATPRAGGLEVAEADRWEKTNRDIYAFNKKIDKYGLKPAAKVYHTAVPTAARHGITNVYNTYNEPLNFINAVLQGKISQAFRSVDRFVINTTLGVGGVGRQRDRTRSPRRTRRLGPDLCDLGDRIGPLCHAAAVRTLDAARQFRAGFRFRRPPVGFRTQRDPFPKHPVARRADFSAHRQSARPGQRTRAATPSSPTAWTNIRWSNPLICSAGVTRSGMATRPMCRRMTALMRRRQRQRLLHRQNRRPRNKRGQPRHRAKGRLDLLGHWRQIEPRRPHQGSTVTI